MLRKIPLLLTFLFTFSLFVYPAFAGTKNLSISDKILSYDLSQQMTSEEKNYLDDHPDLAKIRYEKDTKFLIKQSELEMNLSDQEKYGNNKSSLKTKNDVSVSSWSSPITVTKGTDKTITSFNASNSGTSKTGLVSVSAKADGPGKYADVAAISAGLGSGDTWAWTGAYIYVSGSGSQYTKVKFWGPYKGSIIGGPTGSASGKVRVSIYDLTDDQEVGSGYTAWDRTCSNGIQVNTGNQSLSGQYASAYLQGGHYYLLRYGVSNAVSVAGVNPSQTDFWNSSGSGPEGIDCTQIMVDFQ